MKLQNFGEQCVETGEMFSQRGGGHFHGDGQAAERDVVPAVADEQGLRDLDDARLAVDFAGGEVAQGGIDVLGLGAEDAVRDFHAAQVSMSNGSAAMVFWGRRLGGGQAWAGGDGGRRPAHGR